MMNKEKSRTEKALMNVGGNMLYQITNTVVNIIIPPLIIGKYGSIVNGLISTIKQIISYVQLIGAGIAESSVVSLYKPLADKNHKKISAVYNASAKAFWQAGMVFSVISCIIATIYPFLISNNLNKVMISLIVIALCASGASEFFMVGKYRTLLTADQKIYMVNIAQTVGAVMNLIITVILININVDIVIVQIGSSIIYIMRIFILTLYIKKHYKYIDTKVKPDNTAISRRKAATIHQLAGLITFGSQTVVVSSFCGLAEGSVYSVYNLVFSGINTLCSTLSSALLASFGEIIAKNQKDKLNNSFRIYECIYYLLIFIFYSVAYIMILPFVEVYTSGVTDANYIRPLSATLFAIMGLLNCIRTPGATLINAIGHYDETKNRSIIEMVICFTLEMIFVQKFGMNGVLLGTIVAYAYRTIDVILYSNKIILNSSVIKSIRILLINFVTFFIFYLISNFITYHIDGYFSWVLYASLYTFIALIMFFVVNYFFNKKLLDDMLFRVKDLIGFRR